MPELELYGFELKTETGFDISSVHQALAQTRYVHYSHVVVHCADDDVWEKRLADVRDQAQKYGIGVIRLKSIEATGPFEIVLLSARFEPTPRLVDVFLEDRAPDLLRWVATHLGREG
jgi:hypothetical protein